jgi:hypothetical protein
MDAPRVESHTGLIDYWRDQVATADEPVSLRSQIEGASDVLITIVEGRRVQSLTGRANGSGEGSGQPAVGGGSSSATKRSKVVLNSGSYCSGWARTNSMTLR